MFLFFVTSESSTTTPLVTSSPLEQYTKNQLNIISVSKNLDKFTPLKIIAIVIIITTIIAILCNVIPFFINKVTKQPSIGDEVNSLRSFSITLETIVAPLINTFNGILIVVYAILCIIAMDNTANNANLIDDFIKGSNEFIKEYASQNTLLISQNATITENNKNIQEYKEDLKTLTNEFNAIHSAMDEIYRNLFYSPQRSSRTTADTNSLATIKAKNQDYLNKFKPTTLKMIELVNTIGYTNNSNIDEFVDNAQNDIREIKVITKKFDNDNNLNNSKKLLTTLSNVIPTLPIEVVNINNFTDSFKKHLDSTNLAIEKARLIDPQVNNVESLNGFLNILTENLTQDSNTGQYQLNYGNLSVQQYIQKIERENKALLEISNQLDYPIRSNYDIVSARTLFQSIEDACINIMKFPRNKNIGISLFNLSNAINNLALNGKAIDNSMELNVDVFTKIESINNILILFKELIEDLNVSGSLAVILSRIKDIETFRENVIFYLSQFATYSTEDNAITTINDFKQFFGDRKFLTNEDLKSRLTHLNTRIANFDSCINLANQQYKYVSDDTTFKQMLTDDINWLISRQAPVFRSTPEMLSYRNGLAVSSSIGQSILNAIRSKLQYINNLEEVPNAINSMMNLLTVRFSTKADYESHLVNMANSQLEMFNVFFTLRFNTKEELLAHLRSLEADNTMINNILIKLNKLSYINRATLVGSLEKFNSFLGVINSSQFIDLASLESTLNLIGAKQSTSNAIIDTIKTRYSYVTDENGLLTWVNNHVTLMENIVSPVFVNSGQYISYITQLNSDANTFYTRREKWTTIINNLKKKHTYLSNDDSLVEFSSSHDTLMGNMGLNFSDNTDYINKIGDFAIIKGKALDAIDILNDRNLYVNNIDDLVSFANTHRTIMINLALTFTDNTDYTNKISTINNNSLLLAIRQPKWNNIINIFKARHNNVNNDDDLISFANVHSTLLSNFNKTLVDNNDYYNYINDLHANSSTLTERSNKWTTITNNFKKKHTYLSNDDSLVEFSSSHDTLINTMNLTFISNSDYNTKMLEFLTIRTKVLNAIDILNDRNIYVNNIDDLIGFTVTHRNIMAGLQLTFLSNNDYTNKINSLYSSTGDLSARTLKWANIIAVLNNRHNYINNDDDILSFANMHNALMESLNYYPSNNEDYFSYVTGLNTKANTFNVSKPKWDAIITNMKKKHIYIDNEDHLLEFSTTHDNIMSTMNFFLVNNGDYSAKILELFNHKSKTLNIIDTFKSRHSYISTVDDLVNLANTHRTLMTNLSLNFIDNTDYTNKITNMNSNATLFNSNKIKWDNIIDIINDRHPYISNEDHLTSFVTSHRNLMVSLGFTPASNAEYTNRIQSLNTDSVTLDSILTNINAAHTNINSKSLLNSWSSTHKDLIITTMNLPPFTNDATYMSTIVGYKNSHSDITTVINNINAITLDVNNNATLKNWSNTQKNLILTTMNLGQFTSTVNYTDAINNYHNALLKIKDVHSNVTDSNTLNTWSTDYNTLIKTTLGLPVFSNNTTYANTISTYKTNSDTLNGVIDTIKIAHTNITNGSQLQSWAIVHRDLITNIRTANSVFTPFNNDLVYYNNVRDNKLNSDLLSAIVNNIKTVHTNVANGNDLQTWVTDHKTLITTTLGLSPFSNNTEYSDTISAYKNDYAILLGDYNSLATLANTVITNVKNNCGALYVVNLNTLNGFITALGNNIYNFARRDAWRPGIANLSSSEDNNAYLTYLVNLLNN